MSEADQSGAGRREVAYRMFAAEFDDADYSYSESDEDRAPNYVITPTGARANRLFVVGVLTEVETVSEDVLRARVVDPTGAFVLYAGQYQPDEQAFLEAAQPPTFVAVTGKARTFQPEDGDRIFTSIRPENISEVDAETRDRWTVQAAEQTVERVGWMARALASDAEGETLRTELRERGADDGLAHGISLAVAHYGTTPTYLDAMHRMALDAARVVAGEHDEVELPEIAPDEDGEVTTGDLIEATPTVEAETTASSGVEAEAVESDESDAGTTETATADTAEVGTGETTDAGETAETPETEAAEVGEGTEKVDAEAGETAEAETTETAEAESTDTMAAEEVSTTETAESPSSGAEDTAASSTDETATESEGGVAEEDLGDFDPDEFELESETREQIEEEYGTEFQSGTEVDEPGQADIETPVEEVVESETGDEPADAAEADPEPETESAAPEPTEGAAVSESDSGSKADDSTDEESAEEEPSDEEPVAEAEPESAAASAESAEEPDDMQAAVVDLMSELDDGSGAGREELFAEMDARYGLGRNAVEDAIQDALMEGQCYEPDDDHLKPI